MLFFLSPFSGKMGRLSFAFLTLMFVKLMAEADVFQSKENNYREESPYQGGDAVESEPFNLIRRKVKG